MNHQIRIGLFGITLAGALAMTSPGALAQERFVTIGTGGQTGVYYTAGQSVCRFLNRAEVKPAIKCNAPSTAGSVTNIVALQKGEYDFGFIQSDHQHKALPRSTATVPSTSYARCSRCNRKFSPWWCARTAASVIWMAWKANA